MHGLTKNITEKKFNKLTAVKLERITKARKGNTHYWLFKCACGNQKIIPKNHVTSGSTKSCGCIFKEFLKSGKMRRTHGLHKTQFYKKWCGILRRCNNKNEVGYALYGGRGVRCLWNLFEDFREDMYDSYLEHVKEFGEKNTTIDRINSDGHYCKENCRWATYRQQALNKKCIKPIDFCGKTMHLIEWAEETGIGKGTLWWRLKNGWSVEKAITTSIKG